MNGPQGLTGEQRALPSDSVVDLVQRVCRSEPDRPALAVGSERTSFGELWSRVSGIAGALAETGVGPSDRVLLWADRGTDMVAAALAVMSLRAAFRSTRVARRVASRRSMTPRRRQRWCTTARQAAHQPRQRAWPECTRRPFLGERRRWPARCPAPTTSPM